MFYGDESYGRNDGYFVLLEALRDTFERVEPKNLYLQMFKLKAHLRILGHYLFKKKKMIIVSLIPAFSS